MKKHTTLKIGGPARFFCRPDSYNDLQSLLAAAKKSRLPVLILGKGSNILAGDRCLGKIIVQLSKPAFRKISVNKNFIHAGCGATIPELLQAAREAGLSGLEFLIGIPGTVGGALVMNAGGWDKAIGDSVANAEVMDYNGKIKTLDKKTLSFAYRKSNLGKYIVLGTRLKLSKRSKDKINRGLEKYLAYRRERQDASLPNAGCIFMNPKNDSAGRLIDACGLKGSSSGKAIVSLRHANFILNQGGASCADVLRLMRRIERSVNNKFHIRLKPEIKIWR